jgi:hypothetical protein
MVGTDLVLGLDLQWGMGYSLGGPMVDSLYGNRFAGRRIAFWAGSGGLVRHQRSRPRMTVAYVMNRQNRAWLHRSTRDRPSQRGV